MLSADQLLFGVDIELIIQRLKQSLAKRISIRNIQPGVRLPIGLQHWQLFQAQSSSIDFVTDSFGEEGGGANRDPLLCFLLVARPG